MDWNAELFKSARNGDLERVKECLANGADVNARGSYNETALMEAIFCGNEEVAKFLVEKGADVNAKDNDGFTALMEAVYRPRIDMCSLLILNGADINAMDNYDNTVLMYATGKIYANINAGRIRYREKTSMTNILIVSALLEQNADINAKNSGNWTALHYAVSRGYIPMIDILIRYGADVNARSYEGETPLALAETNEIRELLQKAGAIA